MVWKIKTILIKGDMRQSTNTVSVCTGALKMNLTLYEDGDIGITKYEHGKVLYKRVSVGNTAYKAAFFKLIRNINAGIFEVVK